MQNQKAEAKTYERYFFKRNLLDDLLSQVRIPGEANQVLRFIARKTLGWRKEKDKIPFYQFVEATGLDKSNVVRARKILEKINIIVVEKDNKGNSIYSINLDFSTWEPLSKKTTNKIELSKTTTLSKKTTSVVEKDNKLLSKTTPSIKNYNKELNNKESVCSLEDFKMEAIDEELSEVLLNQVLKNHPRSNLGNKPAEQKKARKNWPNDIAKLRRIDKRSAEEIQEMILWATSHEFWFANIRSAATLRAQWDSLQADKDRESKKFRKMSDEQAAKAIVEKLKPASYEQVLEITKVLKKTALRFDLFMDLEKLTGWVGDFLSSDLRDLKAACATLLRDPNRKPTPVLILQGIAALKARRASEEYEAKKKQERDSWTREDAVTLPKKKDSFETRLKEGFSKLFSMRPGARRKEFAQSFLNEMRQSFPEQASHADLMDIERDYL